MQHQTEKHVRNHQRIDRERKISELAREFANIRSRRCSYLKKAHIYLRVSEPLRKNLLRMTDVLHDLSSAFRPTFLTAHPINTNGRS